MMNYIWGIMIILAILYGTVNGTLGQVGEAALNSSKEAVSLCITMIGIMSFWVGIMEIAKTSGMIRGISRKMRPVIRFLFPGLSEDSKARDYIISNMIANILGLGWAATPAGLKAMEELAKEQKSSLKEKAASNEMCVFLILNISSLQLIPVNIIAYRSQYGSVNPTAVIAPGLVATTISTLTAVTFCKIMDKKRQVL